MATPRKKPEELVDKYEAAAKRREAVLKKRKTIDPSKDKKLGKLIAKEIAAPTTGSGGNANFPNAGLKQMQGDPIVGETIRNIMEFYFAEPVRNDDELCERIAWFFTRCADTNQLPTVEKMGLALGYTMEWMNDIVRGTALGFSPNTGAIIKKAKQIMATFDGELALKSKIQPVVYMFRSKNFYGMVDKQEVVLTPNNPLETTADNATIAAKYEELPED